MSIEKEQGNGEQFAKQTEQVEGKKFKIMPELDGNGYQISGEKEGLAELGAQLYTSLGGSDLESEEAKSDLNNGRTLRPKGYFWVRLNPNSGRLEVFNQNRKGDGDINKILKEAVEKNT